jgi:GNAT superfamily N-acetyltransferase
MTASNPAEVQITACAGTAPVPMLDEVVAVYRTVFGAPPYNEDERRVAEFASRLRQDAARPGFVAWTANARRDGQLLGFATAWPTPEPFPTGRAYGKASRQLGPPRVRDWLVGSLEVDELAVLPAAQGQGIGSRLLAAALKAAPDRRAWLLTQAQATDAVGFYRRRGWHQLTDPAADSTGIVVFLSPNHPATTAPPTRPSSR